MRKRPPQNETARLRVALAEVRGGHSTWCRDYWFPGWDEGRLAAALARLERVEDARGLAREEGLHLHVAAPAEPRGRHR